MEVRLAEVIRDLYRHGALVLSELASGVLERSLLGFVLQSILLQVQSLRLHHVLEHQEGGDLEVGSH